MRFSTGLESASVLEQPPVSRQLKKRAWFHNASFLSCHSQYIGKVVFYVSFAKVQVRQGHTPQPKSEFSQLICHLVLPVELHKRWKQSPVAAPLDHFRPRWQLLSKQPGLHQLYQGRVPRGKRRGSQMMPKQKVRSPALTPSCFPQNPPDLRNPQHKETPGPLVSRQPHHLFTPRSTMTSKVQIPCT